jgi:hypothetical protein
MARAPEARPADALELARELADFDPGGETAASTWEPATGRPEVDTLVLPRGSVARAEAVAKRARRARPLSVVLAGLASLAIAAVVVLGTAGIATLDGPSTPVEDTLSWLLGGAALIAAGTLFSRWLGRSWPSLPEVASANRVLGLALLSSTASLGALELSSRALAILEGSAEAAVGGSLLARALVAALAAAAAVAGPLRRSLSRS